MESWRQCLAVAALLVGCADGDEWPVVMDAPIGAPCVTDRDCVGGLVCNTRYMFCEPPFEVRYGEKTCQHIHDCEDDGLVCVAAGAVRTCLPPGPVWSLCTKDEDCHAGLFCNGAYGPNQGVCRSLRPLGGRCEEDADCAHGWCHPQRKRCEPERTDGYPCKTDAQCDDVRICLEGQCADLRWEGARCGSNEHCAPPFGCHLATGRCARPGAWEPVPIAPVVDGTLNAPCEYGTCRDGLLCLDEVPPGGNCWAGDGSRCARPHLDPPAPRQEGELCGITAHCADGLRCWGANHWPTFCRVRLDLRFDEYALSNLGRCRAPAPKAAWCLEDADCGFGRICNAAYGNVCRDRGGAGAFCVEDEDCVEALACEGDVPRRCAVPEKPPCRSDADCASPRFCHEEEVEYGAPRLRCIEARRLGDECEWDECAPGLHCYADACRSGRGVSCTYPWHCDREAGFVCDYGDCLPDPTCDSPTSAGRPPNGGCSEPAPSRLGEPCGLCIEGLECEGGVCMPPPTPPGSAGDPCNPGACTAGLVCIGGPGMGRCEPEPAVPEPARPDPPQCAAATDCPSGEVCALGGRCGPPGTEGIACALDYHCDPTLECREGLCRPPTLPIQRCAGPTREYAATWVATVGMDECGAAYDERTAALPRASLRVTETYLFQCGQCIEVTASTGIRRFRITRIHDQYTDSPLHVTDKAATGEVEVHAIPCPMEDEPIHWLDSLDGTIRPLGARQPIVRLQVRYADQPWQWTRRVGDAFEFPEGYTAPISLRARDAWGGRVEEPPFSMPGGTAVRGTAQLPPCRPPG